MVTFGRAMQVILYITHSFKQYGIITSFQYIYIYIYLRNKHAHTRRENEVLT